MPASRSTPRFAAYDEAYRRALEHVVALAPAPERRGVTEEARAAAGLVAIGG